MRVLVIDDETPVADTWVLILQQAGYDAAAAYSDPTALELVESFRPHVVVSDVVMPGMSGVEVCAQIQAQYPKCLVLLFSGPTTTNELLENAHTRGYTWEVLAKPVDPGEILTRLAASIHRIRFNHGATPDSVAIQKPPAG
jgi:DNA-binding response OmpR family regulator